MSAEEVEETSLMYEYLLRVMLGAEQASGHGWQAGGRRQAFAM